MVDKVIRDYVLTALDFVAARGPLKPLGVLIRWAFVFYLELQRDLAFIRAAGMAYATVVALVPGLAVVLWVLGATGAGDDPDGTLRIVFDRVFGAVPELSDTLFTMLANVDLQALGVVAVVTLIVVASRLYLMVERAYSDVFGVPVTRRSMLQRIMSFYFTITAVPVVLVVAVRSSYRVISEFGMARWVGGDFVALSLEYLMLVAALKLLPACEVRWRPALVGAFVSFLLIEVGRQVFGLYLVWVFDAGTVTQVYGSLTVVPVFLMWVYFLWVFVLLGVEVAQVSQNYVDLVEKELELADDHPSWPSAETALRVAAWVGWSFESGRGPAGDSSLAERTNLDARDLQKVLQNLRSAGLVVHTDEGWLLTRPSQDIRLAEVTSAWRERTGTGGSDDRLSEEFQKALALEGTLADGIGRWLPAVGPAPSSGTAIG